MKSTSRFSKNKRGTTCLNCENTISDQNNFCPNCGQVNDNNPISLKQYFSEYLSGFFSFDNRFLKTVIPLLLKPGKITTNYVNGKRVSYVNPFQLFLNITIVFFLIQGIFNTVDEYKMGRSESHITVPEPSEEITLSTLDSIKSSTLSELNKIDPNEDLKEVSEVFDSIQATIQETSGKKDPLIDSKNNQLKSYIDSVFTNSDYLEQFKSDSLSKTEKDSIFKFMFQDFTNYSLKSLTGKEDVVVDNWQDIERINELKSFSLDHIEEIFTNNKVDYSIPDSYRISIEDNFIKKLIGEKFFTKIFDFMEYDSKNKNADIYVALEELGYEKTYWNIFYYSKAQNLNKFKDDPEFRKSYADNIIGKISIALFFLLPVFTLVVALLYIRNKYNYTEHLVFVFHVQTAFFIMLMLVIIIDRIFNTDIGILFFFLIFLFYLYKALRNFYQQGRFKTIIKYLILNTFFVILATIGGVIISFIAFLI